jgi:molybdenum cofactor cytidylyltransferase
MPLRNSVDRFAGVLLAAGASSRMGRNKMLVEVDGETLIHRAARRALAAGLDPVIVILGHEADEATAALRDLPCEFAFNPAFRESTSGSLHRGLERLPSDCNGAVVLLADMVGVTTEMIRALAEAARESAAPLAVSRYDEVNAPPLLFRRELFDELLAWHGEGCGKAVVQRHRDEACFLDWPTEALVDVDTPADLVSYLHSRSSEPFG